MESIKKAWAWVTKPFRWVSAKIGGTAEKRNLIGMTIDLVAGIITMPFRIVWGLGVFAKKLFVNPREAFLYILYQGGRTVNAIAALFRIRVLTRDGYHTDPQRLFWVIWGLLVAFIFIDAFIQLGWILAAKIIFGSCIAGFVISGIPNMIACWNEFTFEQWMNRRTSSRDSAQAGAIRQRERDAQESQRAAAEKVMAAEDLESIRRQENRAKLAAAIADQKMLNAKAAARASEEAEIKLLEQELESLKQQSDTPTVTDAEIVE